MWVPRDTGLMTRGSLPLHPVSSLRLLLRRSVAGLLVSGRSFYGVLTSF